MLPHLHPLSPLSSQPCTDQTKNPSPIALALEMLFHHKLRSSSPSLLFSCFHDSGHAAAYHEATSSDCDDGHPRKVCSTAQEPLLPEIRYRCRSLIARIRRCRWRPGHAAAVSSSEFGYDPMSYALNFDNDWSRKSDEEFSVRNFSARLPLSPDRLMPARLPREVVACC